MGHLSLLHHPLLKKAQCGPSLFPPNAAEELLSLAIFFPFFFFCHNINSLHEQPAMFINRDLQFWSPW